MLAKSGIASGRVSAVRSRIMAAIRGKNTRPELKVRSALHAAGFRYRLHQPDLPGHPDIVLTRHRTIVLVHGCFWHRHSCRHFAWPKTRRAFWREKILGNVARDRRVRYFLRTAGWHVHVIWECQITPRRLDSLIGAIRKRSN